MRRRLTVSILVLVAVTLVVTSIVSFTFIRHAALSTAQQELAGEGRTISSTISTGPGGIKAIRREFRLIEKTGNFDDITVIRVLPDGTLENTNGTAVSLPSGLGSSNLSVNRLLAGDQVDGHVGQTLVYTAVPTPIPSLPQYELVVVATRSVPDPTSGLWFFLLVGAIALALAAVVAAVLSRRFTRPLEAAAATTARIAAGDLDATVTVPAGQDPEFTRLAESINTMGGNLVRAREQERQFLLSVSHELRTPLTSIRGYADAVVDGAAQDPAAAAAVISTEARRLERLVQDLLDLARLDANRFSLDLHQVDAAAVAGQVADGFRPRAAEVGIDFEVTIGPPMWVDADHDRLAQVLANLLENAAAFARIRIQLGTGMVDGVPMAWVTDDGPGIPADQLDKVFERHFVSDRLRGRRKGSGLGLAIVAELAVAMGGGVRAQSPVVDGHGTCMLVSLRSGPAPALPPVPLPFPSVTAAPPPPSLVSSVANGEHTDHDESSEAIASSPSAGTD
jgi:signal transduction histidine kinase